MPIRNIISISVLLFLLPLTARAAEITSSTGNGTTVIILSGEIVTGDADKFRRISMRHSDALVVLNSNGGEVYPAIQIGKIIKIAGYRTVVPSEAICTSACALIWIAGTPRYLSPDGRVGFHASYRDNNGKLEESGAGNALVGNYLTLLNLPERAILFATSASPNEIMWLHSGNKGVAGIDFAEPTPIETEASSPAPRPVPMIQTVPRSPLPTRDHHPVSILSSKPIDIGGEAWAAYKFNYLGLTLERSVPQRGNQRDALKTLIDDQISEGNGWLWYDYQGDPQKNNWVWYYINVSSISRNMDRVSFWIKEDHELDKTVAYREDKIYYTINCKYNTIRDEQLVRYSPDGGLIKNESYAGVSTRIIPDTIGSFMRDTVCR